VILYLYNYLYKGADTTKFYLDKYRAEHPNEKNEIMEYRIARYISACEAAIRILEISMYTCTPSVTSINVHLPIATTTPRKGPSDLDLYFRRPSDTRFDTITLAGITHNGTTEPGYFERFQVTDAAPSSKYIKSRKDTNPNFEVYTSSVTTHLGNGTSRDKTSYVYERQKRDKFITRIHHVNATIGEQWYLRLILLHSSPRSYEEARTVNGTLHPTFQAAARAMGLLDDFNEAFMCLQEAAITVCQEGEPLRRLFCILLKEGWPLSTIITVQHTDPNFTEYDTVKQALMSDYLANNQQHPHLAQNELLVYIHDYISKNTGKTMSDYGLPEPANIKTELDRERSLYGNLDTREALQATFDQIRNNPSWTSEFEEAYDMVKTVEANGGGYCVITGGGGVGKTYLTKALVAYYRARNQIVRIAAPTALAATLHVGGMTFHDLCKLNIVETDKDEYTSFLDKHPQRQALLRECKVIFLDEAFATHLQNIKAAIKALQRICETTHETAGKVFVLVGDPLQIPPIVIDETSEEATIEAMVISLPSWNAIPKVTLTKFQRNHEDPEFAEFVYNVANGDVPVHKHTVEGTPLIALPAHLIKAHTSQAEALEWFMPTDDTQTNTFANMSILCADNVRVDELNTEIQTRRKTPCTTLYSSDRMKDMPAEDFLGVGCTPEFLYELQPKNTPPHALTLAVGDIVFLMRNLDIRLNLTNNTRVRILDIKSKYIKVQRLGASDTHLIPRISFTFKMDRRRLPLEVHRLQFPFRLAYAMTFNKSQGQTLDKVLYDATTRTHPKHKSHGAFTHGQLNVALGRVRNRNSIRVLVDEHNTYREHPNDMPTALTANIVFQQIIQRTRTPGSR
jgi:GTPase SAR1 family protein